MILKIFYFKKLDLLGNSIYKREITKLDGGSWVVWELVRGTSQRRICKAHVKIVDDDWSVSVPSPVL